MTTTMIVLLVLPFGALFVWFGITKLQKRLATEKEPDTLPGGFNPLTDDEDADWNLPTRKKRAQESSEEALTPVRLPAGARVPPGTVPVNDDDPLTVKRWKTARMRQMNARIKLEEADRENNPALVAKAEARLKMAEAGLKEMDKGMKTAGHNPKDY
jgi:hypothetical protein